MKTSYIATAVGVVVVLAALFGISTYLSNKDAETPINSGVTDGVVDTTPPVTITAKRQFVEGVHTIAGEIDMPTPCHILDHGIVVAESFPEQVTIAFTLTSQADTCAQVITPGRFKFDVQVSENASFEATLNGRDVIFNLVEVGEEEDLEDFDLFIKG